MTIRVHFWNQNLVMFTGDVLDASCHVTYCWISIESFFSIFSQCYLQKPWNCQDFYRGKSWISLKKRKICTYLKSLLALLLSFLYTNTILRIRSCQWNTIFSICSSCIEMIFILLTESMIIQIRFFKIFLGKLNLERLFILLYSRCISLAFNFYKYNV